jgi:hypothetical protein
LGASFWEKELAKDTFRGSVTSDSICGKADIRFRKEVVRSTPAMAFNPIAFSLPNSLSTGSSAPHKKRKTPSA